jgi:hypothetical protein
MLEGNITSIFRIEVNQDGDSNCCCGAGQALANWNVDKRKSNKLKKERVVSGNGDKGKMGEALKREFLRRAVEG